jgi:hypothetical protein
MEIEETKLAIASGDERLVQRYLTRLPALRDAVDRDGVPLKEHAVRGGKPEIARLFGV